MTYRKRTITLEFKDAFLLSVKAQLNRVIKIGRDQSCFPGGRNGPYLDIESPLRNTAHWLVSFSVAYLLTGESSISEVAHRLTNFLIFNKDYELDGVLIHRQKTNKDWCNGVIGQAWVAEGLLYASKILNREDAREKALQLLRQLPFDSKYHVWHRLDPAQGQIGIDYTYNHQSWFASVAAESEDAELVEQARKFLDVSLSKALQIQPDGLIKHKLNHVATNTFTKVLSNPLRMVVKKLSSQNVKKTHTINNSERDLGYHLYDLYTLARLRQVFIDHPIWKSDKILKALYFAGSKDFLLLLDNNSYSYSYNAPGFEYSMINSVFQDICPSLLQNTEGAWKSQLKKTWNNKTNYFDLGTCDPVTLSARIYELAIFLYRETLRR